MNCGFTANRMTNLAFSGLRGRMHGTGPLLWAHMVIPDPAIASILGLSGVDYVMIDAEHGPFTVSSMRPCIEALRASPANVVVRTSVLNPTEINQFLDLGADGIVVPRVETASAAASIVEAARYPPEGRRGVGGIVRATQYGHEAQPYFERANSTVAVMAIIESARGVENAAEIAGVPGLDGIVLGPTDLAADLGLSRQLDHPRVRKAMEGVVASCLKVNLRVGVPTEIQFALRPDSVLAYCFADAIALSGAARSAVEHTRQRLGIALNGEGQSTIPPPTRRD